MEKIEQPFQFYTRLNLTESTGLRASTLEQLVTLLKDVPGSCVYHHTHRFLQQHEYLSPEPPNDFAYWTTEELGEPELGERLASIDIVQFGTIRALRDKLVATIEEFVQRNQGLRCKEAHPGREFYFNKSISFIASTPYRVTDLPGFVEALHRVTLDSIYFHIFEARLRLENEANDFSNWLEHSMGEKELADAVARLDPYTYALEDLRKAVIAIVERKVSR